jgi:hypothetical protein
MNVQYTVYCINRYYVYLRAEIGDANEFAQEVLGQHVREAALLDVVGAHVDVVRAQVQVRGADGADAPLGLRREVLRLVVARRRRHHLVAVLVHRARRRRRQLRLLARLLLDLGDLLPLRARRRHLHPENDVADLRLRQRRHVHVVLLAVVRQNQVLQSAREQFYMYNILRTKTPTTKQQQLVQYFSIYESNLQCIR